MVCVRKRIVLACSLTHSLKQLEWEQSLISFSLRGFSISKNDSHALREWKQSNTKTKKINFDHVDFFELLFHFFLSGTGFVQWKNEIETKISHRKFKLNLVRSICFYVWLQLYTNVYQPVQITTAAEKQLGVEFIFNLSVDVVVLKGKTSWKISSLLGG